VERGLSVLDNWIWLLDDCEPDYSSSDDFKVQWVQSRALCEIVKNLEQIKLNMTLGVDKK